MLDLPSLPRSCAWLLPILLHSRVSVPRVREVHGRQQYPSILTLDIEETSSFFRYFIRNDIEA